jgi:hypothetical protein
MERKVGGERRRDIPLNDASLNCLVSNRGQSQTPGAQEDVEAEAKTPPKFCLFKILISFIFRN